MRITVKQLKGLIRESVRNAINENTENEDLLKKLIAAESAIRDLIQHTWGRRRVQMLQTHMVLIPIGMRIQVQQIMSLEN